MDPPVLPGAYVRKPPIVGEGSCESRYDSMYVDPVWRLDTIGHLLPLDIARSEAKHRASSNSSSTLRSSSCSLSHGSVLLTVPTSSGGRSQTRPELFSWEGVDEMFPTRFEINPSTALGSYPVRESSGSCPSYPSRGPSLLRKRSVTDLNAQYIRRNSDGSYTARIMTANATAPARKARRLPCHSRSDGATPPLSPRLRSLSTSDLRRGPQLYRLGGYVPVDQLETLPLRPRVQAASDTVSKMKATLKQVFSRQQKAKHEDEKPLLIGLPYDARHVKGYGATFESIMASQA